MVIKCDGIALEILRDTAAQKDSSRSIDLLEWIESLASIGDAFSLTVVRPLDNLSLVFKQIGCQLEKIAQSMFSLALSLNGPIGQDMVRVYLHAPQTTADEDCAVTGQRIFFGTQQCQPERL